MRKYVRKFRLTAQHSFKNCCSDDPNFEMWVRNPFLADLHSISDDNLAKDDLTEEMNSTRRFLIKNFWCPLIQASPRLVTRATAALIPFATIYFWESGFSAFFTIKTINRNKLDAKNDMCAALSKTISLPQFDVLIEGKQQQPSQ